MVGRTRSAVAALVAVFVVGLAVAPTAGSVVDGQFDGNQHPNVGLIIFYDSSGVGFSFCTGTLIDATTVLTAAHCAGGEDIGRPIARITVDFDSHLDQLPSGRYVVARSVDGTGEWDPAFVDRPSAAGAGGLAAFYANAAHDIGLIHLVAPAASVFPGIQPAPIAAPNTLEPFRTGPKKELFVQVGFGAKQEGAPGQPSSQFVDYTRNLASMPAQKLTDDLFIVGSNPKNATGFGAPCGGDSGSPLFRGSTIVTVVGFTSGVCKNGAGGVRVDAGPGRAFLREHGLVP
jgi:hypothetical protein